MTTTLQTRPRTTKVLRHLMEKQQAVEIGERIRGLRSDSSETNRSIADHCEVGERTVAGWIAGDGISYKNAKKVAALFDVDIDWLWRGREKPTTGSPLDALSAPTSDLAERLEWIEGALQLLLADRGLEQIAPPSSQRTRRPSG
jgi:transcriptional regulator with XRE-family HTH domain